jgi:DNA replication licensing factor MCM6
MAASSDAGYLMSDGPLRAATTPRAANGFPSSSSARPRGPPSENTGAPSEYEGDGFADDQVPKGSRIQNASNIPRVEDRIGIIVQEHFEQFIEG